MTELAGALSWTSDFRLSSAVLFLLHPVTAIAGTAQDTLFKEIAALEDSGRHREALDRMSEQGWGRPPAYGAFLRGQAYEALGQPDLALAAYEQALAGARDTDNPAVPRAQVEQDIVALRHAAAEREAIGDLVLRRCGDQATFCNAVLDIVETGESYLDTWWAANLDQDPAPEAVARICSPQSRRALVVIDDAGSLSVVKGHAAMGLCSESKGWRRGGDLPRFWRTQERSIVLREGYHSESHQTEVGLVGGLPAKLRSEGESHSMSGGFRDSDDYVALTGYRHSSYAELGEVSYGIVAIRTQPGEMETPTPSGWTTFGLGAWQGPQDAAVTVTAQLEGDTVILQLSVTDDRFDLLPASNDMPTPGALLAHDHVELWWCRGAQCTSDDKTKSLPDTRQLAVSVAQDGVVRATWLYPEGNQEPLPTVSGDRHSLRVAIGRAALIDAPRETWDVRFTAAYSDSDGPDVGQETLVASSQLKWAYAWTFGSLVFPRYQAVGRRVDGWQALRDQLAP